MARRIGAERVELWTPGMEQYGKTKSDELVAEFTGCWMEFSTAQGANELQENIASVLSSIWVPAEVELQDADDYFVWARRPSEKYRTDGDVSRYYDRRGNLRACVIPVVVKK